MFSVSDPPPPHLPFKFRRKSSSASTSPPFIHIANNEEDEDRDLSSPLPPSSPLSPASRYSSAKYATRSNRASDSAIYDQDDVFSDVDAPAPWSHHYVQMDTSKQYIVQRPVPMLLDKYGSYLATDSSSPVSDHFEGYGLPQNQRWADTPEVDASADDEDEYDLEDMDIHIRETYFATSAERGRWQSSPIIPRTRPSVPFASSPIRPIRLHSTPVKSKDTSSSTLREHTRRHSTNLAAGEPSVIPLFYTATDDDREEFRSSSPLPPSSAPASPMSLSPSHLDDNLFEDDMVLDENDFTYDSDSRRDDVKPLLDISRDISTTIITSEPVPPESSPLTTEPPQTPNTLISAPQPPTQPSSRYSTPPSCVAESTPASTSIPVVEADTSPKTLTSDENAKRPLANMKNKPHPGETRENGSHLDVETSLGVSIVPLAALSVSGVGFAKQVSSIAEPRATSVSGVGAKEKEIKGEALELSLPLQKDAEAPTASTSALATAKSTKKPAASAPLHEEAAKTLAASTSTAATVKSSVNRAPSAPPAQPPKELTQQASSVPVSDKARAKPSKPRQKRSKGRTDIAVGTGEPARKKCRLLEKMESSDIEVMEPASRHRSRRSPDVRERTGPPRKAGTHRSSDARKAKTKSRSRSRCREDDLTVQLARICDDGTPPPSSPRPSSSSNISRSRVAHSPPPEQREENPQSKLYAELTGMLIEALATSRASSLTPTALYSAITQSHPHLKNEERGKKEWLKLISDVLESGGMFEKVDSSGENGEARWFYVPERDEDRERAGLISALMPRQKRSETKKYKQYYYRPLDRISRWDPEDAP